MKKHKIVFGIELTLFIMIVGTIVSYAAGSNPPSDGVKYTNNGQTTVQGALNDLYSKIDNAGCNSWQTRTPDTSQIAVGGSRTYYAGIYPSNFTVSCANKTCPTCPSGTNISLSKNDFKAGGTYTKSNSLSSQTITRPSNFTGAYTLIVFVARDKRQTATPTISNATLQTSFKTTSELYNYVYHEIYVYKVSAGTNATLSFSPSGGNSGMSYLLMNGTYSSVSLQGGTSSNTTNTYTNSTSTNKIVVSCNQTDIRSQAYLHDDAHGVFRSYAYTNATNTFTGNSYAAFTGFTVYEVIPNGYLHVANTAASDNSTSGHTATNQYPRLLVFTK